MHVVPVELVGKELNTLPGLLGLLLLPLALHFPPLPPHHVLGRRHLKTVPVGPFLLPLPHLPAPVALASPL